MQQSPGLHAYMYKHMNAFGKSYFKNIYGEVNYLFF